MLKQSFKLPRNNREDKRRPADQNAAGQTGGILSSNELRQLRNIDPGKFLQKVLILAASLLIFVTGTLAQEHSLSLLCASLFAIPVMVILLEIVILRDTTSAAVKDATLWFGCTVVVAFGCVTSHSATTFLCQFGIGMMLAHGSELAHQALHRTGTGIKRIDNLIGTVLCVVTGTSYSLFQYTHHWHHRFVGSAADRESFGYAYDQLDSESRSRRCVGFIRHIFMIGHWSTVWRRMWYGCTGHLEAKLVAEYPSIPKKVVKKAVIEYRLMALSLLLIIACSICYSTSIFMHIWLVPLIFAWGPTHAIIEMPEHWRCDNPDPAATSNTRSFKAGWFTAYLTNNNDCHVGHHHDGRVPMDKLNALERMLHQRIGIKHLEESYPSFYLRFLKYLWSGQFKIEP
ncbi:MAG TPA: fatty acid desaturase [Planctomycetaceae bacterium]|nr:fatty acid desaturase [Planctomycetaceae bacterium]